MQFLNKFQTSTVSGGCIINVGGYSVNATGINCEYANLLASMSNYDLNTSGVIGYQPGTGGYANNPYYFQTMGSIFNSDELHLFYKILNEALPANLFPQ